MKRTLGALLLLLATACVLSAQPEDVRVSPPDPKTPILPASAKFEASSTRGDRTLVVWGSSALDSSGQVVTVLVAQIVRGGVAEGVPIQISSMKGRPAACAGIVQLQSVFVVLWRDARANDSGVAYIRLDSLGVPLGQESRLAPGLFVTDSAHPMCLIGDTLQGGRLIWHVRNVQDEVYSVSVDSVGITVGEVVKLGRGPIDLLHHKVLPGVWILRLPDSIAWIVASDGRILFDSLSNGRFNGSHLVGSDSSLIVLDGVNIVYYRKLFDLLPTKSTTLSIIDSASGNAAMLARGDSAAVRVFTVHFAPSDRRAPTNDVGLYIHRLIKETRINSDWSVDTTQIVLHDSSWNGWETVPSKSGYYHIYNPASVRGGGDNTSLMTWTYMVDHWISGSHVDTRNSVEYISLDSHGEWRLDSTAFIEPVLRSPVKNIAREMNEFASIVTLTFPTGSTRLSSTLALYDSNITEKLPGLIVRNEEYFASWIQPGYSPFPRMFRWDPSGERVTEKFDTISRRALPPLPSGYTNGQWLSGDRYKSAYVVYVRRENLIACIDMQWRFDEFKYYITHNIQETTRTYRAAIDLSLPGVSGYWLGNRTDTRERTNFHGQNPRFVSRFFDIDPNRVELVFSLEWIQSKNPSDYPIAGYDITAYRGVGDGSDSGHVPWSMNYDERFLACRGMIPSQSGEFIGMFGDRAVRVSNGKAIDSTTASSDSLLLSTRLLGPYYLLLHPVPSDSLLRRVVVVEIGRDIVVDTTFRLAATSGDFFVVQHPRDSVVGILYGGDRGIHGAFLNVRGRQLVKEDSLISKTQGRAVNPAGLFRDDTLLVVWEDYRRAFSDIYSNRVVLPKSWGQASSIGPGIGDPNEVAIPEMYDGIWSLVLGPGGLNRPGRVTVELFDIQGRLLRSEEHEPDGSGSIHLEVSLEGLARGVYMIRLRGDGLDQPRSYIAVRQ